MEIQLAQVSNIAEDHLEETQDAENLKVKDLFKSGDIGIVGGSYGGRVVRKLFILKISLEDGEIISENILTSTEKYRSTISDLKSKSTADTGSSSGSSHPIGFRVQSAVTQLGMGFAVVIGLVLLAGLYEIQTNPGLVAASYLGIALFGYYDLKLVQGYDLWNPFGPLWLISLLFPGLNIISAIGYMGRRWTVIYGDN